MRPIGRTLVRSTALATVLSLVVTATTFGVSWAPVVAVSASGHAYSAFPRTIVVAGSGRVHVSYGEDDSVNRTVWYRSSGDDGATFHAPVQISHPSAYGAFAGSIGRDGTNVDIVWLEFDASNNFRVWYRRSINNGTDWGAPLALTAATGAGVSPDVARSGNRVTVAFTDGLSGKVYVRTSTNGGVSFGGRKAIGVSTNQPYQSLLFYEGFPSVGDSNGTINVAWSSSSTTIKTRRSTDGGANWSTLVTLSSGSYGTPITLTTAASKVIIGFKLSTAAGSRATQFHSTDEGAHWAAAGYVGAAPSGVPSFAYGGGVLRTLYTRCTASDCSTQAAFFRTSTNFGASWSAESRASRSSDTPYAIADGVGVLANGQSIVIYGYWDGAAIYNLYARKTV
jgi:hypothetical protein